MRPSATESLYKELDIQEGAYEYNLPLSFAIRPLKLSDLEKVVALEEKGFPENERATREKLEYRLTVCPEMCAGVFQREYKWVGDGSGPVVAKQHTLQGEKLVGHIIATKTDSKFVDEESMKIGCHKEDGETIAIHSLVIDPEFQGRHVGYVMLKDYIQKFFGLCNAERMALLAHDRLISFYSKHGFQNNGRSACTFGGEAWYDLYLPFDTYDDQLEE